MKYTLNGTQHSCYQNPDSTTSPPGAPHTECLVPKTTGAGQPPKTLSSSYSVGVMSSLQKALPLPQTAPPITANCLTQKSLGHFLLEPSVSNQGLFTNSSLGKRLTHLCQLDPPWPHFFVDKTQSPIMFPRKTLLSRYATLV